MSNGSCLDQLPALHILLTHTRSAIGPQVWKDSGFDVRVGEQLLESSYVKRWQKQAQSEAARLQAELLQMIRGCVTVPELALVVRGVSEHMAPDTLVAAISRVTHLPLVRG